MKFNDFKITNVIDNIPNKHTSYSIYKASISMLNQLNKVKPIINNDLTKVYTLENHLSFMWSASQDTVEELSILYKKPLLHFILEKTFSHLNSIFTYWDSKLKVPCYIKENSLDTLNEFINLLISDYNKETFKRVTDRLLIELRSEEFNNSNYIVVPHTSLNRFRDRIYDVIYNTVLSFDNISYIANMVELFVRIKYHDNNLYRAKRVCVYNNNYDKSLNPDILLNINDKSHLSLETVVCMTPQTLYYGLSKGRYDSKSDSIIFLYSSELFNDCIKSYSKMNYNTMSFGTETDR